MIEIIKRNKTELIVSSIFLFFAFGFNVYRVQSDGTFYYSFLEYILRIPDPESVSVLSNNPGFYQSGCAYFNVPFYLVAYLAEKLFPGPISFNGITLRQIAINLASNFYMLLSLLLSVRILKRLNFKYRILPVLSVLFSTTAFTAAVIVPSFNHAVDIFLVTLTVYFFIIYRDAKPQKHFWLGPVYVLLILVRYTNFILIVPLSLYYLAFKEFKKLKYLFIGIVSFIWVLPLIFYIYNGNLFSFMQNINDTGIFFSGVSIVPKYFFKNLLHPVHGLFIWSPVTILSILGLLFFPKMQQKLAYLLLGFFLSLLLMYSFIPFWYGGWSFSNRYLSGLFPIFVIGLAAFLERYKKKAILLIVILTSYSIVLYFSWRLNIVHGEYGMPQDMITAWRNGEAPASYDKEVNLKIILNRLYETCRYKYILKIIR